MNPDWKDGYPAEYGYIYEYQPELNPSYLRFAMVNAGFLPPAIDAPFSYCELGFGQGVTLNVLASAHPAGVFVGNDFNPEHVRFARTLQEASGASLTTYEDSFEEFCARPLPQFDFIVAHGVWSWVNPAQWTHIVKFVRRQLRPGGVFYVSYNALPGWSRYMPLHEIVRATAGLACAQGLDRGAKVRAALSKVGELRQCDVGYFGMNPQAGERFDRLGSNSEHYLAHEYLNQHWTPSYFHEVQAAMADAKLTYACSADLTTHRDFLELDEKGRALLATIESPTLRETYRDFLCNRQFRRDLYVKGAQRLSPVERREQLSDFAFALRVAPGEVSLILDAPVGRAELDADVYTPVVAVLGERLHEAVMLADLLADPRVESICFEKVYEALFVLVLKGDVAVVSPGLWQDQRVHIDRFNAWVLGQATRNRGLPVLACPVTRGAQYVSHLDQLFIDGIVQGMESSNELIEYVDLHARNTGRRVTDDEGREITDAVKRKVYLETRLNKLRRGPLSVLQSRGMIRTIADH